MSQLPAISLPQYEGPLDLLLDLVRQHRLNILELPISEVTRQYLDYIHQAQELNIELGAEFIFMAATLILIKSRTLLPRAPVEPDPSEELAEQLISHEQAKQAGEFLAARLLETANTWSIPGSVEDFTASDIDNADARADQPGPPALTGAGNINLLDALRLIEKALAVTKARRGLIPERDAVTLEQMIQWLANQLHQLNGKRFVTLEQLFQTQATRERRAMLFLSLLEMARQRHLHLEQEECFGPIQLSAGDGK
ncbi:MAG: segregation and condensation protein A [Terriglobia bacterium]